MAPPLQLMLTPPGSALELTTLPEARAVTESENRFSVNCPTAERLALITVVHPPEPVQLPPVHLKLVPAAGCGVRTTEVFRVKRWVTEQLLTQVSPGGVVLTMRRLPLPDADTLSVRAATNVPVTARLAVIRTVQRDPLTVELPLHADSRLSAPGVGVRTTVVP